MVPNPTEKALSMLRYLPRVCLANIRGSPNAKTRNKRGRAQHGGDKHGCGNKGSGQRQNFMRLGYETGNNPFYLRFSYEPYYKGHHLRREYPPLSMLQLLKLIELNRVDDTRPIDLVSILNSGCFKILPDQRQYGVQLSDEGADVFNAKVNIEVQYASEIVIAAIERAGGVITTAYYDMHSLQCMLNTKKFFERGMPIPRRMMPPRDAIEYYSDPKTRGYLADPVKVNEERLVLAQKYGYELPVLEKDKDYEMLNEKKDPRQIFYGLHPGWVVNLKDKAILKPEDEELKRYYAT